MWGRRVRLTVTEDATGTLLLDVDELRIDFEYVNQWTVGDLCTLQVYNLALDEVKSLVVNGGLTASVYAGYYDEVDSDGFPPKLCTGRVTNAYGRRELPNHITSVFIIPEGNVAMARNVEVEPLEGDVTLEEYVAHLATRYDFPPPYWHPSIPDSVKQQLHAGKTVEGTGFAELRRLTEKFKVLFQLVESTISIFPDVKYSPVFQSALNSTEENVIPLDVISLKGIPSITPGLMSVPYNLSTNIKCGAILDTTPFLSVDEKVSGLTDVSGLGVSLHYLNEIFEIAASNRYMCVKAIHKGSSEIDLWGTDIEGAMYLGNLKGAVT
jgi:hypothetical protein